MLVFFLRISYNKKYRKSYEIISTVKVIRVKEQIHPKFQQVIFFDASANYKFLSASTKSSNETMEWEDGNTYPVIRVDTSSASHPFFTGRQRNNDVGGRVDRFNKKYNLNSK